MQYTGYFRDNKEHQYKVVLVTNNSTTIRKTITLTGTPCVITQSSDGIFSPIKSRACTVNILSKQNDNFSDLYTIQNHGVPVTIYEAINDESSIDNANNSKVVFKGYATPCAYNQPWVGVDEISIEAVDAISTLKNIKYTTKQADEGVEGAQADFVYVDELINRILKKADLSGDYYYPSTLRARSVYNQSSSETTNILHITKLMESNFFDDDDEKTAWSCYEVLEEISKYFGWTLVPYEDQVYFIDYSNLTVNYYHYVNGSTSTSTLGAIKTIQFEDYLGDDADYSYDDVHSKITISQNAYDVEDLIKDPFKAEMLNCVTTKEGLGSTSSKWTESKRHWFHTDTTVKGYDYCTFYELKPESGWTHTYYDMNSMDSGAVVSNYKSGHYGTATWRPNQILNTKGALVEKFTGYSGDENTIKPTSLGWSSAFAFFCYNDTLADFTPYYKQKKVLTYKSTEKLRYSPSSSEDTTYVMLTGDIWYQTYAKYEKKKYYNVWNSSSKLYAVNPSENCGISAVDVTGKVTSPGGNTNTGWDIMKYRLRIGDKYWNGSTWTTTESDFTVKYGNVDGSKYKLKLFEWISPVYNHDYTDKIGEDCWAIPITAADNLAGDFQLDIYTPAICYPSLDYAKWHSTPVVYLKDFSLGVKFVDQVLWYVVADQDSSNDDIVFSGQTDIVDVVSEDLDTELKINSFVNEGSSVDATKFQSRLSRSHVLTDTGYLGKISMNNATKQYQENNLVNKYLAHYGSIKKIYEVTLKGINDSQPGAKHPYDYYTFTAIDNQSQFVVDSYEWNLATRENRIKFIEK